MHASTAGCQFHSVKICDISLSPMIHRFVLGAGAQRRNRRTVPMHLYLACFASCARREWQSRHPAPHQLQTGSMNSITIVKITAIENNVLVKTAHCAM